MSMEKYRAFLLPSKIQDIEALMMNRIFIFSWDK